MMTTCQIIRIVIMIESAADITNEVVVVIEVEVEVSNEEEKIEERGNEKDTTDIIIEEVGMMIENERSVVIGPAVDPCQEVAHHHRRRRHRCHHVLIPLETDLSEDIVAIVTVGTANEGTKVKAIEKNEGSHPNDIIGRGGNGLNLCLRHHHLLLK